MQTDIAQIVLRANFALLGPPTLNVFQSFWRQQKDDLIHIVQTTSSFLIRIICVPADPIGCLDVI